ncbi:serine/threonine protein kinase [bacterium]|nr:serine/threonine protein kinase [bacterium]
MQDRPKKFLPNQVLCERFHIESFIGEGASAAVYKVWDEVNPERASALKIYPATIAADKKAAHRLHWEVRGANRIQHPNVVRFYEFVSSDELIAILMEYVNGQSLRSYLRKSPQLSFSQIHYLLVQIAAGLEAIHSAGLVHRDLKPANILLSENQTVKLTDLGVVLATKKDSQKRDLEHKLSGTAEETALDELVGTPYYMSPEYVQHGTVDSRSDIYAFGVIAYELIAGVRPFEGVEVDEIVRRKIKQDVQPLSELKAECPKELANLVMQCLERDPSKRPQLTSQVIHKLRIIAAENNKINPEYKISKSPSQRPTNSSSESYMYSLGLVGGVLLLVIIVLASLLPSSEKIRSFFFKPVPVENARPVEILIRPKADLQEETVLKPYKFTRGGYVKVPAEENKDDSSLAPKERAN